MYYCMSGMLIVHLPRARESINGETTEVNGLVITRVEKPFYIRYLPPFVPLGGLGIFTRTVISYFIF